MFLIKQKFKYLEMHQLQILLGHNLLSMNDRPATGHSR